LLRKKKSSKSKSKDKQQEPVSEALLKDNAQDGTESPAGSSRNSPAAASRSDKKTAAEKRFEEVQKRRVCLPAFIVAS
jgi:protein FAM32A